MKEKKEKKRKKLLEKGRKSLQGEKLTEYGTDGKKTHLNRYIYGITCFFVLLFLGLIGYMCYFQLVESPKIVNNSYNTRLDILNSMVARGSILAADGSELARTEIDKDGTEERIYPYGAVFAHVVGYSTRGETGLESAVNLQLLNSTTTIGDQLLKQLFNNKIMGDSVVTTLDPKLQKILYDSMSGYEGAAVVMEPSTGKILAMVSKPDYDPNKINEIYNDLISSDSNSNLVNRVTQGLYSPGSIFKIVTLLEYIRENSKTYENFSYTCNGSITVGDETVRCSHGTAHGVEDLEKAFAKSCNGAFITAGLELKIKSFQETAKQLLFNQKLPYSMAAAQSKFKLTKKSSEWDVALTSFGQGGTEVTPLHVAMLISAIANDGVLMKPYLIEGIDNCYGESVETYASETYGSLMTKEEAELLTNYMVETVNNGTASVVKTSSYQAAAKTGSAQIASKKNTHAWFVAFAPAEDPQLVVSIVLEEAGTGSENAGPIAKKIFDAYLAN